jgi:hypothetical protein
MNSLEFRPAGAHTANSSLSSAVTLTPPTLSNGEPASQLLIQAFDQNIRLTLDGTTPTANTGFQIEPADRSVLIPVALDTTVKIIEETAGGSVQYQWGR